MIYVFTSATGPRITYTGSVAEEILKLAGRSPGARGVIPAGDIADVEARLRAAIEREAAAAGGGAPAPDDDADDEEAPPAVPLARRLVPFFDLLERARLAGKDVTWGL